MVWKSYQTGIVAVGISMAIFAVTSIIIVAIKNLSYFRSLRNRFQSADIDIEAESGDLEKYGELYIAPDQQPTVAGLNIITQILMVTALSSRARPLQQRPPSPESAGTPATEPNRINSRSDSPNRSKQKTASIVPITAGAEAQLSQNALPAEKHLIENMRKATLQLKADHSRGESSAIMAQEESELSEGDYVAFDPMSFTFGSGRSMAQLYRN
jgi:hypothetical protein